MKDMAIKPHLTENAIKLSQSLIHLHYLNMLYNSHNHFNTNLLVHTGNNFAIDNGGKWVERGDQ